MTRIIKGYYQNHSYEIEGVKIAYLDLDGNQKTIMVPVYYWSAFEKRQGKNRYFEMRITR